MSLDALPRIGETVEAQREETDWVLWSVTTVIDILDKAAIKHWLVGMLANRVVDRLPLIARRLEEEGREEAVKYVRGLQWDTGGLLSDSALGTAAHGLFDVYALSGTRPTVEPELHPKHLVDGSVLHPDDIRSLQRMLVQFDRFLTEYQPEYIATEAVVFHPDYGYAGQADAFMHLSGIPVIADYKTSRRTYNSKGNVQTPWPEVSLQLAAYRYAALAAIWRARRYESESRRYYLLSPEEKAAAVPVPEVEKGVCIKITPERYGVYPVRCGPEQHRKFLHLVEAAGWKFNDASAGVLTEMAPPHPIPEPDDDPFAGLPT